MKEQACSGTTEDTGLPPNLGILPARTLLAGTLPWFQSHVALAGVAQWTEHWPANKKVTSLIPGQGMCQGCGTHPQFRACKRQNLSHTPMSLSFPPSLPLSKKLFFKAQGWQQALPE